MNGTCNSTIFGSPPPPGALGRGQRSNIIKISITKSISKIFRPNSVCLLTNERYKTSQMGFSFDCLGHAAGLGLGGTVGGWGGGVKNFFFLKFNLSLCVTYLHEWHMQQHNFLGSPPPWALGRDQRSNIIKSQLLSHFQIFLNQTMCVFYQMKDIKHIRRDFHSVPWVMPKGLGLGGAGGKKLNFLNMVMWHIKLKGMNSSLGYFMLESNW